MPQAQGDNLQVRLVAESTYGVTPTNSVNWKAQRITGDDLTYEPVTEQSEEIAGVTRGVSDLIAVGQNVSGGFPFELSVGSMDDIFQALLGGTWASDILVPGNVFRSFTIEKYYSDIARYLAFKGMVPNSLSLDFQPRAKVVGSVGFAGSAAVSSATSLVGTGTVAAANTNAVMRTGAGITGLKFDGVAAATVGVRVRSIQLTIEQQAEPDLVVDSDAASSVAIGGFKVSAALETYFDNATAIDWVLNNTNKAIEWQSNSGTKSYKFELPKFSFSGGAPAGAKKGAGILVPLAGTALIDAAGIGQCMRLTRDLT